MPKTGARKWVSARLSLLSLLFLQFYLDCYLLWRFWREGWIANKTLQKLAVQVLESELVLTYLCKAVSQ